MTSKRVAWQATTILCFLYAASFFDRFIPAVTAPLMARDLGLGDQQLGLLFGAAFAIIYATTGIPISQLIDRGKRKTILVAGAVVWGVMTMAAAFAQNFEMLILCRIGVAIGEATLTPAAISLIADMFAPDKRTLPTAIYLGVSSVMAKGALILGGGLLFLTQNWALSDSIPAWRLTLFVAGVPTLLGALAFCLLIPEPKRMPDPNPSLVYAEADLRAFLHYLRRNAAFYAPLVITTGLFAGYSFSVITWGPALLVRKYGFSPAHAALMLGTISVPVTIAGTIFWPWLHSQLQRRGKRDSILRAMFWAHLIAIPPMILAPLASSLELLLAGFALFQFSTSSVGTMAPMAMQNYGPPQMRARLTALELLGINLFGLSTGPYLVAVIASRWSGDPQGLAYGLAIYGAFAGVAAALGLGWCLFLKLRTANSSTWLTACREPLNQ